jgi:hypothetical protein
MQHINSMHGQKASCQNITADGTIRGDNQNSQKLECRAKAASSTVVLSNGLKKVTITVIVYG